MSQSSTIAPRPLTAKERRRLTRYVRRVADLLRLKDWTITVSETPAAEENLAQITPVFGQQRAAMAIGVKFLALSAEDQRQTIVHELLHCHLFNTDHVVEYDLKASGALSDALFAAVHAEYQRQREYAVDAIAEAIAGWLPPIEW